jgi:hypothetical protein
VSRRRMRSWSLSLVVLALLPCAEVRAQVCTGFGSLSGSRYRLDVSAASYTYATAVGASVTAGRNLFATVGVGSTRDAELHASTYDLRAQAGYDVPMGREPFTFCPLVMLSYSLGPYDFMLHEGHFTYLDAGVGLGLAVIAVRSARLTVIPAVGARYSRLALRRVSSATVQVSQGSGWVKTDWYGLLNAGLGIVIDNMVTVRPGVSVPLGLVPIRHESYDDWVVPFGREESEISLNVSIGVSFGRRHGASR